MSFLRARQSIITRLFPHQANPTHLIGNRPTPEVAAAAPILLFGNASVGGSFGMLFNLAIDPASISTLGWSVTVDLAPATVGTVVAGVGPNIVVLTYTVAGTSGQVVEVTYDDVTGILAGLNGVDVASFVDSDAVP